MDDVLCRYDLADGFACCRTSPERRRATSAPPSGTLGFEDEFDAGGYPTSEAYLAGFARRLQYPITREQWVKARRAAMTANPGVLRLAAETGGRARIVLHTNNGPLLKETLPQVFPEAKAVFGEECYFSYEFAAKKPDPLSYTRLLDRLGVAPHESWFIDDKPSNVEGARNVGLNAHHFVDYDGLVRAARSIGL